MAHRTKALVAALIATGMLAGCASTKTEYIPQAVFPTPPEVLMQPPEEFIILEPVAVDPEENV